LENTFAKAAGAEPSGQMRDGKSGRRCVREANFAMKMRKIVEIWEKCAHLWREARFQVKMVKNSTCPDNCWKLRCSKGDGRYGPKHISK
jgi:hypothetical protein